MSRDFGSRAAELGLDGGGASLDHKTRNFSLFLNSPFSTAICSSIIPFFRHRLIDSESGPAAPAPAMPLELVREIDDAVAVLMSWRIKTMRETKNARMARDKGSQAQGISVEEMSGEGWYLHILEQPEAQCIRLLALSPVLFAAFVYLPGLMGRQLVHGISPAAIARTVSIVTIGGRVAPLGAPLCPFQRFVGGPYWVTLLELPGPLLLGRRSSELISYLVWMDFIGSPILSYVQGDISDREEIHYLILGVLLAAVFEWTGKALRATTSLLWATVVILVAGLLVVLASMVCLIWYLNYAPAILHVVRRRPYRVSVAMHRLQSVVFLVNRATRWLLFAMRYNSHETHGSEGTVSPVPVPVSVPVLDCSDLYSQLPPGYVRLLRLLPAGPSEEIRCEFAVAPLKYIEPYEAISYVWGDPTQQRRILVDGKALLVTASAHDILRRRRSRFRARLVWIDRVCINQDDLAERAAQIFMMTDIYRRASVVTAWLGDLPEAHLVQELFAELHCALEEPGSSRDHLWNYYRLTEQRRRFGAHFAATSAFFRSPWFFRVWIVQEAVCARRLHVLCGGVCMDWVYVCRGADALLDRPLRDLLPISPGRFHPDRLAHPSASNGLRNAETLMTLRGDLSYHNDPDFFTLLQYSTLFVATKPHDKIYALLDLARDRRAWWAIITPDYEAEASALYISVMKVSMQQKLSENPLFWLASAGVDLPRHPGLCDLPSWVPDWNFVSAPPLDDTRAAAGTHVPFRVRFDSDPSAVHLRGNIFDSLDHLGSKYRMAEAMSGLDEAAYLEHWIDKAEAVATRFADPSYLDRAGRGDTLPLAVLHTASAGRLDDEVDEPPAARRAVDYAAMREYLARILPLHRQLRNHSLEDIKRAERNGDPWFLAINAAFEALGDAHLLDLAAKFARIKHFVERSAHRRRFCVTAQGRMVLVPGSCRSGDVICILAGARLPCVLREVRCSGPRSYRFVGCCYVYGMLKGEVGPDGFDWLTLR